MRRMKKFMGMGEEREQYREQALRGAQKAHQIHSPQTQYQTTWADGQDSSGNAGPTADLPYRQPQNRTKKTEREPEHFPRKAINTRADHDKKRLGSRNQYDIVPNESGPSVRNIRGEPGVNPHRHRPADVGETAERFGSPSKPEEKMRSGSRNQDDIVSNEDGLPSGNNPGRLSYDPNGGPGAADVGELPGLSPTKSEDRRTNQDDMPTNETYLPDANIPKEPGLDGQDLPRDVNVDEVSGPLQGKESQKTEIGHEEDSSDSRVVMNRISRHLNRVEIELPSTPFEREIPRSCSLVDIEMAIVGLIRALQSTNRDAHDTKIDLAIKTAECESLQTLQTELRDDWAQKSKVFQDMVSDLEREKEEIERDKKICVENTASVLRTEYKNAQEEHESKWNKKEGEFLSRIQQLVNEKETLKDEYEGKVNKLEKQHQGQIITLQRDSEGKIAKIEADYNNGVLELENEIEQLKDRHEDEVEELQQQHRDQIDMLQGDMQGEIARTERDCNNRVSQLEDSVRAKKQQYEMDKRQIVTKYHNDKVATERDMQTVKNNLYAQMNAMRETHNEKTEEMAREIEKIKKDHDTQQKQLIEAHDAEKALLERQREEENRSLREHNESLKEALVKRDRFKAMSDRELANRFQDLTSDVDLVSRVRWDDGRVRTWPFPDKSFRNSKNTRMDKQYLVQNTIWVILYEKIFCTPFKVLGEAGKSLEQEWIERYGRGRKSTGPLARGPNPSKESEKWRYETIKRCLEATSQSLQARDPSHNLKRDYESSVKEATEEILKELGKVTSVTDSDRERFSDLVRGAAKLWLEIGQQRYRLLVLMSDTDGEPSRSGQFAVDRDGTQKLVVVPELRRIGNAQGERLEKDELVADCKGVFSVFYFR